MLRQPQICVAIWILHGRGSEGIEAASRPAGHQREQSAVPGLGLQRMHTLPCMLSHAHATPMELRLSWLLSAFLFSPGLDETSLERILSLLSLSLSLFSSSPICCTLHMDRLLAVCRPVAINKFACRSWRVSFASFLSLQRRRT